jgi:hypothetical protein
VFRTPEQLENTAFDAWRTARRMSHLTQGVAERSANSRLCVERCSYTEPCLMGRKGLDEQEALEAHGYTIYDHNADKEAATDGTSDDE